MIPIIRAEEIVTRRERGAEKYVNAVEKQFDWIKKNIESSKDGRIIMKTIDFTKEMGPEFANRTPVVIYRHIKSILFEKDIIVEQGTHNDGDKLLVMRFATKLDRLRGFDIELDEGEGKEEGRAKTM